MIARMVVVWFFLLFVAWVLWGIGLEGPAAVLIVGVPLIGFGWLLGRRQQANAVFRVFDEWRPTGCPTHAVDALAEALYETERDVFFSQDFDAT